MFYVWDREGYRRPYGQIRLAANDHRVPVVQELASSQALETQHVRAGMPSRQGDAAAGHSAHYAIRQYKTRQNRLPFALLVASQVMSTPVIDINISQTLWAAWQQMQRHRVRYLPVCRDNKLAGLLTERQFLFFRTADRQRPVVDLLASTVLSAHPESSVEEISQLMLAEHLPAMPVVNDDDVLVGIVSRSDILRRLLTHGTTELWA